MNRKKLLVPVNIQTNSTDLLHFASSLASLTNSRISFVSVMNDMAPTDKKTDIQRRSVEMELSKIVNRSFQHGKTEFDIIVTRGEFAQRILQMSTDLGIDLILIPAKNLNELQALLPKLAQWAVLAQNKPFFARQMTVYVNLSQNYLAKIQAAIQTAHLLDMNLQVVSYSSAGLNQENEGRMLEIHSTVEKENITCIIKFDLQNSVEPASNFLTTGNEHDLILLGADEMAGLDLSEPFHLNSYLILPTQKSARQQNTIMKQHSYN